jgi:hypothetical protein
MVSGLLRQEESDVSSSHRGLRSRGGIKSALGFVGSDDVTDVKAWEVWTANVSSASVVELPLRAMMEYARAGANR